MSKERLIYVANIAYELGKWAFAIILIGTIIHYFLATIFVISGPSMEPEFHSGEIVLVSRIGLFTGKYSRGDPMVIKFPGDPEQKKYIKRLIGVPGDTVEIKDNRVYINGQLLTESYIKPVDEQYLPGFYSVEGWAEEADALHKVNRVLIKPDEVKSVGANEFFLMGDNRENSNDSRVWGTAPKAMIVGPVRFVLWPFKYWGPIVNPYYGS